MQFGRVPEEELDSIDFSIPKDHPNNKNLLGSPNKNCQVYVGCAKWGRKDWIGKIYPSGTKEKDFLNHYVHHFGCIEMNATHYRVFANSTIEKWKNTATDNFKFCPKFTNSISHFKRLKGAHADTVAFYEQIEGFEETLGPPFLQLHHTFGPKELDVIEEYLKKLPSHIPIFLELRHPDWFEEGNKEMEQLAETCQSLGHGLVMTDTAGRRDVLHNRLTIPTAFIRFVGNSLHSSDYKRIDEWVNKLKSWIDNGLEQLYFFMHMHDERDSPELGTYLIEHLNKACGLKVKTPKLLPPEDSPLF